MISKVYTNDHIDEFKNITNEKLKADEKYIDRKDILQQIDKALLINKSPKRLESFSAERQPQKILTKRGEYSLPEIIYSNSQNTIHLDESYREKLIAADINIQPRSKYTRSQKEVTINLSNISRGGAGSQTLLKENSRNYFAKKMFVD